MKNHFPFYMLVMSASIVLAGCCSETDSTVSDGYPYGAYHELRFNIAQMKFSVFGKKVLSYLDSQHVSYFTNKDTCNKILRGIDSSCNCSSEDLTGKALIYVYGSMAEGYIITKQPRILINHKTKEYIIELRGHSRTCRDKPFGPGPSDIFSKWVIAPKPPDGYKMVRKHIAPYSSE